MEAHGARNGVGLVKLMGRESGFIAAWATLTNSEVNFCLIPEVTFSMEGFLSALGERLQNRGHAVIVVGEGAARDLRDLREEARGPLLLHLRRGLREIRRRLPRRRRGAGEGGEEVERVTWRRRRWQRQGMAAGAPAPPSLRVSR